MQIRELLDLEEYQRLRKRELEVAAEFVAGLWNQSYSQDFVRGALMMLSKLLRVPEEFAKTPETILFVQSTVARDFAAFETQYLRKHIMPAEDEKE